MQKITRAVGNNHYHHNENKVKPVTDRTKHGPTITRQSHLYNRGPYRQPGPGWGHFKPTVKDRATFFGRIKNFFSNVFLKKQ